MSDLPTLPYQLLAPAVSSVALTVTAALADHDPHPVRAARHAAVTVALVVAVHWAGPQPTSQSRAEVSA
jgi:hypothetical protein